jgi:hypothetical protein
VAYVRTVRTASGATAVQVVCSNRRGSREIEHIGSAHSPGEVEVLKTVARQRLHAGQDVLDFDDGQLGDDEAPIVASQARHLWEMLSTAFRVLGFDRACNDQVFGQLVLARVVEPTSKLASIRVLEELGIAAPSYPTIKRRLPVYATEQWRQALAGACADHVGLGPATLVLYDVTTLYFETDQGDGFREPGFSKERRLEPQITVGLLTDVRGFPLQVHAFEGNTAETKTIVPVIQGFAAAHGLPEVTVVADAGMMSEANLKDLEDAGLKFIVGARIPDIPYQVKKWRQDHPDEPIPDGQIFIQPTVMGPKNDKRTRKIFYQYRSDRAKRTLKGIDQQIAKAEKAIKGQTAIKRNRYVQLTGATKTINRELEAKTRALAGFKGLRHQPGSADPGIRARGLPPTVEDREELPDVQVRSAGPADLPPQARVDRSPPHHRDGRPRGKSLAGTGHRLVDQATRSDATPPPQHRRPGRRPHPARRHPSRRRRTSRDQRRQGRRGWTLI